MVIKLVKWGNSLEKRIPKSFAKEAGVVSALLFIQFLQFFGLKNF